MMPIGPPPAGSWSAMGGIPVIGATARRTGLNWVPVAMLTGTIRYGALVNSGKIVTLCPFGMVQY